MWVRWLATVRSPRNSAAATSRFVRPSATRTATRRSAAVSPSSRVRPPMLPSSPRAFSPRWRRRAARSRRALPRSPRGPGASAARAAGRCRARAAPERRPKGSPTASCCATACSSRAAAARRPRARGDETAAPRHVREHPLAADPDRVGLPDVEDSHRVVDAAELEEQLDVVGAPPADARLAPPERRGPPLGLAEPRRRPRPDLHSRARRARGSRCAAAGGARTALRPARGLAPSARGRARAGRDGRR